MAGSCRSSIRMLDEHQINLHRKIRTNVNKRTVEPVPERAYLMTYRLRVDQLIDALPVKTIAQQDVKQKLKTAIYNERSQFRNFNTVPNWLKEISEQLQVTIAQSPGKDENANAVHAIRLLLKRGIAPEKKLIAINKIIGDIK